MLRLTFTGRYSELKNHGFAFQALYARNYRQWARELSGGHTLRVWQKGNTVEIDDFYGRSGAVADFLLKHDPVDVTGGRSRKLFPDGLVLLRATIELKTGRVVPYDEVGHCSTLYFGVEQDELSQEVRDGLLPGITAKNFYEHFRTATFTPELVAAVRELFAQKVLTLVEEPDAEPAAAA